MEGWKEWEEAWERYQKHPESIVLGGKVDQILEGCQCLLLQREIPEAVNQLLASMASRRGTTVVQDVGGEDRPMTPEHLQCCDYLVPNETELERLVASMGHKPSGSVLEMARFLQSKGGRNILVTQGSRGATLLTAEGQVYEQLALPVAHVVDETGAGDCFRAAFCVALSEGQTLPECLRWAAAAGACAVQKQGAVPSAPTRQEVEALLVSSIPRGGGKQHDNDFPFLIGSRLNSMKDRPDLWDGGPLQSTRDWVRRQATVQGLTCVDFNYPQHFHDWTVEEAKACLEEHGLVAGAVCLRYPSKFARGAMNHPSLRREAIDLTLQAAGAARVLGCSEVVVWSAYDGYDYPFQVNYRDKWNELVDAFRECCDAYPDLKFSVEYKPTDENTRFFTIPSTGAALLMVQDVDRPNFGLTLDVGHMLMSGENPGQSIAMARDKLFGIQLNDGYTRLAAEDGLMFGSVHPGMALEIMYQLRQVGFAGHIYFDTFPQRSDPVGEAEYNIRKVKAFWKAAGAMDAGRLAEIMATHDALGALAMVDEALQNLSK